MHYITKLEERSCEAPPHIYLCRGGLVTSLTHYTESILGACTCTLSPPARSRSTWACSDPHRRNGWDHARLTRRRRHRTYIPRLPCRMFCNSYNFKVMGRIINIEYSTFLSAFLFLQIQARRVNAVALAAWPRAVVEHVPQMRTAFFAAHFYAARTVTGVFAKFNILAIFRIGKTRPSRARIKFGIGRKQLLPARRAFVYTLIFRIYILSRKGSFGTAFAHNTILFGGKLFFKFLLVHLYIIILQPFERNASPRASLTI